jgi:hypothetical protein
MAVQRRLLTLVGVVVLGLASVGFAADARAADPRTINPTDTDPAILDTVPRPRNNHLVWLAPEARRVGKLLVFLPSGGLPNVPSQFSELGAVAGRLGYHTILLAYRNEAPIAALPTANSPGCGTGIEKETAPQDCAYHARLELLDGGIHSSVVDVDRANSIENRLAKLLEYLVATAPREGWENFLEAGGPKWPETVISGHSLGAGQAVLAGMKHRVFRVAAFGGWTDTKHEWVTIEATPSEDHYALIHARDILPAHVLRLRRSRACRRLPAGRLPAADRPLQPATDREPRAAVRNPAARISISRRAPRNKGMRSPADPPTVDEIVAVMRRTADDRHGWRARAIIVVLWRAGLRIQEALELAEHDLDAASRGSERANATVQTSGPRPTREPCAERCRRLLPYRSERLGRSAGPFGSAWWTIGSGVGGRRCSGEMVEDALELVRRGEVDVLAVLERLRCVAGGPVERLAGDEVLVAVGGVHPHAALEHVPPVRAGAQVIGQALGGGAQVGAGRQPDEADHHAGLIEDADLEIAVGDRDGHVLTGDGTHGRSPRLVVAMVSAALRAATRTMFSGRRS